MAPEHIAAFAPTCREGERSDPCVWTDPGLKKEAKRNDLTALLRGLIGPVLAVFHAVAHLAAVDTLPVLAAELFEPLALRHCCENTTEMSQNSRLPQ